MGLRPARSVMVAAGLVAALGAVVTLRGPAPAASQPAPPVVVVAEVVDGSVPAASGEGWRLEHPETGRYVVEGPGRVDVASWDAVADVKVLPRVDGRTEVRFDAGGVPVDTAFTFTVTVDGGVPTPLAGGVRAQK